MPEKTEKIETKMRMFEVTVFPHMRITEAMEPEAKVVVIANDFYGAAINAASALITQHGFLFKDTDGDPVVETEDDNLPITRTKEHDVFQWGNAEAFAEMFDDMDQVDSVSPRCLFVHDIDSDCYLVESEDLG